MERKDHWDTVYSTKNENQVSWTQPVPARSLSSINSFNLPKSAKIIDIGGGNGTLAEHLLKAGYENITVLDISGAAIEKTKKRLGKLADKINWIAQDIVDFNPEEDYDIWHDRATFHFLTEDHQKEAYLRLVNKYAKGYISLGTFSIDGPIKCSGLPIQQYDQSAMEQFLKVNFTLMDCVHEDHTTPFDTVQKFIFCDFKRI